MDWTIYILRCADGTLYCGVTNNLARRLTQHNAGRGAKYTMRRGPVTVVYTEDAPDRSAAQKREAAIKKLTRPEKLSLIKWAA
ncbi:GIY-YIG nuclease family protein [Robiginitomaculum antarcticum]|uniref:GIY-YIG nuclease family protein n=1 Tax=Robiginitomaculum antarcticum TaxID=437507 RepID=UPI00035FDB9A